MLLKHVRKQLFLILLLATTKVWAVAPSNDYCDKAIVLVPSPSDNYVAGTTLGTVLNNYSSCIGNGDDDVHYKFVANATSMTIKVQSSSGFNAVVHVTDTECSSTSIACQNNTSVGGLETVSLTFLTPGRVYYIRVYDFGVGVPTTSDFTICVVSTTVAGVANDDCSGAYAIGVLSNCSFISGTTLGATASSQIPGCDGISARDVWYKFTANQAITNVQVQGSSDFNPMIEVYEGSCGGKLVACQNKTSYGGLETATISSTSGQIYYARIYDWASAGTTLDFSICVTSSPASTTSNDECAGAFVLTGGATCVYNNSGSLNSATTSSLPNGCGSNINYDVWYKFVATTSTAIVKVNATGATNFDPVLEVLEGSCTGNSLGCRDYTGSGGIEMFTVRNATIGGTYYVRVAKYGTGLPSNQSFTICVTMPSTPSNDLCVNATSIGGPLCTTITGNILAATQSDQNALCAQSQYYDVWYKFIANISNVTLSVQSSTNLDAVVEVLNGCNGASVMCKDATGLGGLEALNLTGLTQGNTYYVRVYSAHTLDLAAYSTDFTICAVSGPPANDECANAVLLTSGSSCSYTSGFTNNATLSAAPACTGVPDDDVWYKFVAQGIQTTIKVVSSPGFDAAVQVLDGCNGTSIQCMNATGIANTETLVLNTLTMGQTYYVRVYDANAGKPASSSFDICITHVAAPNDDYTNAVLLTPGSTCSLVSGSTQYATQSVAACTGTNKEVWYKFVATSNTVEVFVVGDPGFDPVLNIRDGGPSSTTSLCINNTGAGGTEGTAVISLTVGNTYYLTVSEYSAAQNSIFGFKICVRIPAPPANDNCSNAQSLNVERSQSVLTSGDNYASTQSLVGCTGTANDDIWYKFVADNAKDSIYVKGDGDFDAVVELFTSCGGTSLVCRDDNGPGEAETIYASGLTVGQTYYFRVYDYLASVKATSTFKVCVYNGEVLANDNCSGAFLLPVVKSKNTITTGYNRGATQSLVGCTGTANDDVWYKFVADNTKDTIYVKGQGSFDAVVELYSSCGGAALYCKDATTGGEAETIYASGLTIGQTYYFRVYDYYSTVNPYNFDISVYNGYVIENDNCNNSKILEVVRAQNILTTGTTRDATQSLLGCTGNANDDVWYAFIADDPNDTIYVKGEGDFNAVVELFGSCGGTSLVCRNNTGVGQAEIIYASGLTVGQYYFVRVYDYGSSVTSPLFNISIYNGATNPNDECVQAQLLPIVKSKYTLTPGTNKWSTQSLPMCGNTFVPSADVWYKFVADNSSDSIYVEGVDYYNAVVQLFTSCGGASIVCKDDNGSAQTETIYASGLIVGQTYYFRVYDYFGASDPANFNVSVYNGALITSNHSPTEAKELKIYPNPVNSDLNVDLSTYDSEVRIEFFDINGKQILTQIAIPGHLVLNVAGLLNGVYTVKVSSDTHLSTGKVVIAR